MNIRQEDKHAMATQTPRPAVQPSQAQLDTLVREILPQQGQWGEDGYLWLTDQTSRLIEFTDGYVEDLPMPTDEHQTILAYLYHAFFAFLQTMGGKVLFAPLRLKIREGKFREPDLVLLRKAGDKRRQNRFWLGADLVVEIVSADQPQRDVVDKRLDYAEAQVPEYWIVDPRDKTITVLKLEGTSYVEHGIFNRAQHASSVLLDGFSIDVSAALDVD